LFDARQQHFINQTWDISILLKRIGVHTDGREHVQFSCPFPTHPGEDTRPSARYFRRSNDILCFTEQRLFTPLDMLYLLGYDDTAIWSETLAADPSIAVQLERENQTYVADTFILAEIGRMARRGTAWVKIVPYLERVFTLGTGDGAGPDSTN